MDVYIDRFNDTIPARSKRSPRTTRRWRSSPWTRRQPSHPTTVVDDSRLPRLGISPTLLPLRRTRRTISTCDRRGEEDHRDDDERRHPRRRRRARRAIAFRSSEMSTKGKIDSAVVRRPAPTRTRSRRRRGRPLPDRRHGRPCRTVGV